MVATGQSHRDSDRRTRPRFHRELVHPQVCGASAGSLQDSAGSEGYETNSQLSVQTVINGESWMAYPNEVQSMAVVVASPTGSPRGSGSENRWATLAYGMPLNCQTLPASSTPCSSRRRETWCRVAGIIALSLSRGSAMALCLLTRRLLRGAVRAKRSTTDRHWG